MGGNCCKNERKTTDFVHIGNYVSGNDNTIIDHRKNPPSNHPSNSTLYDGSRSERPNKVVVAEDIVNGDRNTIVKGQISKEVFPRPCTTSTNGTTPISQQGNLVKKNDDKDDVRNIRIVAEASKSVGIIRGPKHNGTGFRVGDCYIMTALHVVDDIMKSFQHDITKEIDYTKVDHRSFYIEFEFMTHNQKHNPDNLFNFSKLVYKNNDLDTAILKLRPKQNKAYPPSIGKFAPLIKDNHVYLIGHPNREPMMDDPKIEIYDYSEEKIQKSIEWAMTTGHSDGHCYDGINNDRKTLFHCACQHGASGAIGIMVMPHDDDPIGVLMLLKGYPEFYYSKELSFSNSDKDNFEIVEQGVLLTSIKDNMELESENQSTLTLKDEIFSYVTLH